ncbi:Gfo/Idh/MocA family protein [Hoeflea prorocentri]|uniref:Gfo/Idh/MocA family oxidoreductase n=1 Tax=Hoeflea prorocentri TaxID=1922333 RepID=A0A9X3UFP2_9HYPH|nr:Gfo/Idh/MocA family oxidoreductase [Hoeflea prorocentri]MCY6379749.1 Gfo/Idh/MocA family oxidoreductase [Hoeflea prorocentri]MDA5397549.1 Gfo/Idh/MocA family oxidoreductase [Hoeflea prorocentri]
MGIAILGTGRVAEIHAEALTEMYPDALVGGWNRTFERAEMFCRRFGGSAFRDLNDALNNSDVEAVIVTTKTETHFEIAKQALECGKHVLLEKPLCTTAEEIGALADIARKNALICMPSHNYIYAPIMRRMRARVERGDLGKIGSYWALFNNVHPADVGQPDLVMRELMIHHVYSMLFFLGRPSTVTATATNTHFENRNADDQIMITAQYPGGTIANLWGSFSTDDATREPWSVYFKLLGTKGGAMSAWDQIKFGPEPEPLWDDASYRDSFLHAHEFFLEHCLAKGTPPLSSLEDAQDCLRILDAARMSVKSGEKTAIDYS